MYCKTQFSLEIPYEGFSQTNIILAYYNNTGNGELYFGSLTQKWFWKVQYLLWSIVALLLSLPWWGLLAISTTCVCGSWHEGKKGQKWWYVMALSFLQKDQNHPEIQLLLCRNGDIDILVGRQYPSEYTAQRQRWTITHHVMSTDGWDMCVPHPYFQYQYY